MAVNRISIPSANGQHRQRKPARPKTPIRARRRIAYAVGGVGVGVLGLSVAHCTEAISALTGSHWFLAMLLAIGVDAGMVGCELAELVAHNDHQLRRWAGAYVVLSIGLSMLLNAYAFGSHSRPGMVWAGVLLGVVIPGLVFILGRVAGLLARA